MSPNVFQQGNMPIYVLVYLVTTQNIRVQRTPQSRRRKSVSPTEYIARTPSAWELADTLVPSQKTRNKRNLLDPVLYLLYCLKCWELLAERTENLALFFETCYLHICSSPLQQYLFFSLDPFPLCSFLILPSNQTSNPLLSSICACDCGKKWWW